MAPPTRGGNQNITLNWENTLSVPATTISLVFKECENLQKVQKNHEDVARYLIKNYLNSDDKAINSADRDLLMQINPAVAKNGAKMEDISTDIDKISDNVEKLTVRVQNMEYKVGIQPSSETMIVSHRPKIIRDLTHPASAMKGPPPGMFQVTGTNMTTPGPCQANLQPEGQQPHQQPRQH